MLHKVLYLQVPTNEVKKKKDGNNLYRLRCSLGYKLQDRSSQLFVSYIKASF